MGLGLVVGPAVGGLLYGVCITFGFLFIEDGMCLVLDKYSGFIFCVNKLHTSHPLCSLSFHSDETYFYLLPRLLNFWKPDTLP